jgi:hypothetical protein
MSHYRRPARRPVDTSNRWPVWGAKYGPGGHRVTTPQFLDRSHGRNVMSLFANALRFRAWHSGSPFPLIELRHVDAVGEGSGKGCRTAPG